MKPQLVSDWRDCWRWFSIQAMAAALALQSAWMALPDDLRGTLPEPWTQIFTIALLVLGVAGRLVDQPTTERPS